MDQNSASQMFRKYSIFDKKPAITILHCNEYVSIVHFFIFFASLSFSTQRNERVNYGGKTKNNKTDRTKNLARIANAAQVIL